MTFKELDAKNLSASDNCNELASSILDNQIPKATHNFNSQDLKIISLLKNAISQKEYIPWSTYTSERLKLQIEHGSADEQCKELLARYVYDCSKSGKNLGQEYPPLVQIEVASSCNYRCVFCYQTDSSFSGRSSDHMGMMSLDLFKLLIDEINGKIPYITIASRGEPLLNPHLKEMLYYAKGKFLDIKINTNGSLLTPELTQCILDCCNTIVISADAESAETYERLRVNGSFKRLISNITMLKEASSLHPRRKKVRIRISGVFYSEESQDYQTYQRFFDKFADETSFVQYNPWEKIYTLSPNEKKSSCSQLLYRFFVWQDGTYNVCDMDYKSTLCSGEKPIGPNKSLLEAWQSTRIKQIRLSHIEGRRMELEPCKRCPL